MARKSIELAPAPADGMCHAVVSVPPHYFEHHFCTKRAKVEVRSGVYVCGTHERVVEKWGDSADAMIEHWWTGEQARRSTVGRW